MQRFAHAMQALEFKGISVWCHMQNRRHSMGVMRRELRVDAIRHPQQFACIGDIGHVGRRFVCEHREIRQASDLCAFYFRVPIRTFHKADHDFSIKACG